MYLIAANLFNISILHRYLQVGHSQNAGNSMHSCIERRSKNRDIFTQDQWVEFMKQASTKKPYVVTQITQDDIFNFREPANLIPWKKVRILPIKQIQFNCADSIKIKHENYDISFKDLNITKDFFANGWSARLLGNSRFFCALRF